MSPDVLSGSAVALAVLAASSAAPLIAYAAAPALAIAFWRNALAVGVLGPFVALGRRAEFRAVTRGEHRRQGMLCALAGLALAAHFAAWMPSVKLTSVATAAALVSTQPVWQGLIAVRLGRRLPVATWIGIAVAVGGAALATGVDFGVSRRAFVGDLLAVLGAICAAAYTALGERARSTVSTVTYTTICYSSCALVLLVVCLVGGVRLAGYGPTTWLAILGLVVGAQLLGHSMLNYALQRVSATTVSVLILLQVPVAALLGWLWLGQAPRLASLPGLGLLLVGVAIVVLGGARRRPEKPVDPVELSPPVGRPGSPTPSQ